MTGMTQAQLKHLRMSPQKVRLVAELICGMSVTDADVQLTYSKKRASRPIKKLLASAVANAKHNVNLIEDGLKIENIFVDEGPILYRWMPRAMGRATPLRKRSSHITLVLSGEIDGAKVQKYEPKEKTKEIPEEMVKGKQKESEKAQNPK